MICYSLICSKSHTFESWFANAEAYDKLKAQNLLSCPECGTSEVDKAIMAPNVSSKTNKKPVITQPELSPSTSEKAIQEIKAHIKNNSEDVGENFAVIARKMHEGETPERNIHGKTSLSEAKSLSEDGVPIIPIPWLNRKTN